MSWRLPHVTERRVSSRTPASQLVNLAGMDVHLVHKRVKNINLRVRPDGTVAVSAPRSVHLSEIERFLASKKDWIERMRKRLAADGGDPFADATPAQQRAWKETVQAFVPLLVEKWEAVLGVKVGTLAYRNMKSRWGSCQPSTGRICINTRLALYPPECLEYVVVHELCHLQERGHGPGFYALMDAALPGWREARDRLKAPPMTHL